MGTDFVDLIIACLEEMSDGPWPVTGITTAAGLVSELEDTTDLKETSGAADPTRHVGKWVRVWDSATPTVENIRLVKAYAPDTGKLTPEADFTAAPGDKKAYELHKLLHPTRLKTCITDALAELRYQEILPLTLVADGDMESIAVVTTLWGTDQNGTPLKDTTYVLFGIQSLKVTASAANGYTYPKTNIPVTPGDPLLVWAPVYGDQQGAKLILYDVTNGAEIETARHDEEGWGLLWFQATVPKGCYEVRPHLMTITNLGNTYWDHVGILKCNEKVYDSPSWLSRDQDFIKVVSYPYGGSLTSPNADHAYSLWHHGPQHEHVLETIFAHRGVVPLRLQLGQRPSDALFVIGKRRYPALTADTDETEADAATVKAGALALAYRRLGDDYRGEAAKWAYIFNDLRRGNEPPITVRQRSCWRR